MIDDYEYGDEWDWDRNDSSQHCRHGTFIGSWWGPDILCGACEDGLSVEADRYCKLRTAVRRAEDHPLMWTARTIDTGLGGIPFNANTATLLTAAVLNHYDEYAAQLRYIRRCKAAVRLFRIHHPNIDRELEEAYA